MIAQEKLQVIKTVIRQSLPRLMEPTEGCKLNFKKKYFLESVEGQVIKNYNKYVLVYSKEYDDTFLRAIEHCEIIGHDILLSDVLEWLGLLKKNNEDLFHCSLNEEIMRIDMDNKGRYEANMFKINISKPRLADQSEELWEFLYNLLEDNE